ncbi:putative DNA polymerase beta chain domain protein [Mycobacterium kansasii]|uniref:Putative DNA polymerase beta chain domain protein n=1 Tax=Mycobacterium kansasii TaxID=1768 RepID=A0A1V3WYL0_MYCKA|nr:putative DNA polymerase beta chain domain protein [Mycobacterium kansasii]
MDPVTALRQIAYYKDRSRHDPRRVMAYRNAADLIEKLDDAALERHGQANSWQSLPGIGPKTAKVIDQAWSGREPDLLIELRSAAEDLGGERCAPRCGAICTCIRTGRTGRCRSRR